MGKRKPQKKTTLKKQQPRRETAHPPLTIGDRVRVKDNVMDPDYADQCIGG